MLIHNKSTAFFVSLLSAGLIALVLIQRRVTLTPILIFQFEALKSIIATILWIWLLLDSIIVNRSSNYYPNQKWRRVLRASLAIIVLL